MPLYTFHIAGFGQTFAEFHPDQESVERAAFDTALEGSRSLGRLSFVTVRDADGELV